MGQPFAMDAMLNEQRYEDIVPIEGSSRPGVDYTTYFPHTISFQPPYSIEDVLRNDYKQMQIGFIYANAPSFDEIMERLSELQSRFRTLE